MTAVLELDGVTKAFDCIVAVDDLSLNAPEGSSISVVERALR